MGDESNGIVEWFEIAFLAGDDVASRTRFYVLHRGEGCIEFPEHLEGVAHQLLGRNVSPVLAIGAETGQQQNQHGKYEAGENQFALLYL